jgi:hypothetical protein
MMAKNILFKEFTVISQWSTDMFFNMKILPAFLSTK